jgi:hypothetical protein
MMEAIFRVSSKNHRRFRRLPCGRANRRDLGDDPIRELFDFVLKSPRRVPRSSSEIARFFYGQDTVR